MDRMLTAQMNRTTDRNLEVKIAGKRGETTMSKRLASTILASLMFILVLSLAPSASAANRTWSGSGTGGSGVDFLWNNTSLNWNAGTATFADGDDVRFDSETYDNSVGTITIQPGGVKPKSIFITGQRASNTWQFDGGDIADFDAGNPTTLIHEWGNRAVKFTRESGYTFSGGTTIRTRNNQSGMTMSFAPLSGATTNHYFGTGDIHLEYNRSYFKYTPADTTDTLMNNFVINEGAWVGGHTGTVAGTITLDGTMYLMSSAYNVTNTLILSGDRRIYNNANNFTISGPITQTGGPHNLTLQERGDNYAWYLNLSDNGGTNPAMDVLDVTIKGVSGQKGTTKINADERTYFSTMKANGGTLIIDTDASVNFARSNTIELNVPMQVRAGAVGFQTNTGINVVAGGSVGGDGVYVKNTGGIYSDVYDSPMTITVNTGGTLAPGNSIGTMTIYGDLVLTSGSTLNFEFGGLTSDRVNVWDAPGTTGTTEGNLTLDGTLNILGDMVLGQTYTLFDYDGALTDAGLELGTVPTWSWPTRFEIDTTGGVVTVLAIPEPASAVLLGLAGLLVMRRRR